MFICSSVSYSICSNQQYLCTKDWHLFCASCLLQHVSQKYLCSLHSVSVDENPLLMKKKKKNYHSGQKNWQTFASSKPCSLNHARVTLTQWRKMICTWDNVLLMYFVQHPLKDPEMIRPCYLPERINQNEKQTNTDVASRSSWLAVQAFTLLSEACVFTN